MSCRCLQEWTFQRLEWSRSLIVLHSSTWREGRERRERRGGGRGGEEGEEGGGGEKGEEGGGGEEGEEVGGGEEVGRRREGEVSKCIECQLHNEWSKNVSIIVIISSQLSC